MSDTVETNQRRSLKENLRETVDILKHSEIGVPKAILIAIVVSLGSGINHPLNP